MRIHTFVAMVALSLAAGTACEKSTADADKNAAAAAKEAKEAADKANAAKLKSDEESAKAKLARAEARTSIQKDFDAHERKTTYLKEKVAKATGDMRKNADAAATELDKRRDAAKASIAKIQDDASPTWEAAKKQAQDDVAAVGKGVDALEATLNKK